MRVRKQIRKSSKRGGMSRKRDIRLGVDALDAQGGACSDDCSRLDGDCDRVVGTADTGRLGDGNLHRNRLAVRREHALQDATPLV